MTCQSFTSNGFRCDKKSIKNGFCFEHSKVHFEWRPKLTLSNNEYNMLLRNLVLHELQKNINCCCSNCGKKSFLICKDCEKFVCDDCENERRCLPCHKIFVPDVGDNISEYIKSFFLFIFFII